MSDILASVSVVLGAEVSGFKAGLADARKELKGFVSFSQGLETIGTSLTKYVSAPLALIGGAALKVGGDFQSAFNRVQADTQASGAQLDSLRAKAQGIALDPKLKFSSVEAAQAIDSLAKNGLNVTQILGGAADASTALATATGAGLATAADITTDVMNNFGKSAAQAAGLVSNITGTTIASKFGIDDYRLALGQAGAVAGQLGVSFEDFNTALGVTSSGFSSGSDAGTSFKTFLQHLVPQSKEAEAAIKQLGLNFFDAQGKMRPLRDIAGQLQQAFKGLSDQQKNTLGTQIFGTDSIRTALLLAKDGVAGFDEMAASIAKVNAASQGGILNQGFVGAFESFKSSLEGLAQTIADNGILDFATSLAQEGAVLASGLAQADPALLKFGVGLAAIVAATGPVLVAVGSLGAALPFLEAGFALLAGPVGIAVAAFAALAIGGAALIASNGKVGESVEQVGQRFEAQKSAVQQLQTTFSPLLDRYDELKAKSNLTATEQEELRSIIEKVGTQIPTTITQFDAYGKAMDINSEAARGFIQRQREIAEQANKVDLSKQRDEYRKLEGQIANTLAELNQVNETGVHVKFIASGDDEGGQYFARTAEEIQGLQTKLDGLYASRRGVGGLIDQLKGIPPPIQQASQDVDYFSDKLTGLASVNPVNAKMQEAFAKLRADLQLNDNLSRALGSTYDYVGERSKILEGGVKSLISAGFSPLSSTVQKIIQEQRGLATGIDQLAERVVKGTEKMGQTPDFKLDVPKLELPLPEKVDYNQSALLPDYKTIFGQASLDAAAGSLQLGEALTQGQENSLNRQRDFNTNIEGLTNELGASIGPLLGDVAGQFANAFGSIVTGTASAGDALTQLFGGVLASLSSFMSDFGKKLIAIGIGKIGLDTLFDGPQGGPLAIAAGVGLLALAGVASSISQGASSSLKSIGSGGVSTSVAAPTRNYTPTTAPAAPAQVTVKHDVTITAHGDAMLGVLQYTTDRRGRTTGTPRGGWLGG